MPRSGLSTDVVLDEAARILDTGGLAALTMARLADDLGVRPPSLYKHVDGMPAIVRGVTLSAKQSLCSALGSAAIGKARDDAIAAMSLAYRAWARAHPGQYPLTMHAPAEGDAPDLRASAALVDVVARVLEGYELRGENAVHAIRFVRAALHGFVTLETSGGFELPVDLELSFTLLVESVITALSVWPQPHGNQ